jgi:uncharacterized protein (TIGR02246 family)
MGDDLNAIRAELAIRGLAAGYCDAVNQRDGRGAAEAYWEDAELAPFYSPVIHGRQAIGEALAAGLDNLDFMMQICANGLIRVDGDRAQARWSVIDWFRRKDTTQMLCGVGMYEDTVERRDGGWRFSRRRFHPLYAGDAGGDGKLYRPPSLEQTYAWPFPGG